MIHLTPRSKRVRCPVCQYVSKSTERHAPAFCALMKAKREGKRNKFGAERVEGEAGRSFMSKGERDCSTYLRWLEKAGKLRDLEHQVSVVMTKAALRWVLDFKYFDLETNETIYADFKGFEGERWNILKKLWPHYGTAPLRIFKGKGMEMVLVQEIRPKGEIEL